MQIFKDLSISLKKKKRTKILLNLFDFLALDFEIDKYLDFVYKSTIISKNINIHTQFCIQKQICHTNLTKKTPWTHVYIYIYFFFVKSKKI